MKEKEGLKDDLRIAFHTEAQISKAAFSFRYGLKQLHVSLLNPQFVEYRRRRKSNWCSDAIMMN